MKLISSVVFAGGFAVLLSAHADPAEDAAKALAKKAAAHVRSVGSEKACADFASPTGGFMEKEMYVFVETDDLKMVCHAENPRLNGKDLSDIKDSDGVNFSKKMAEASKSGGGWVHFKWPHPETKVIEAKTSYIEPVGNGSHVGAGVYRK